MIARLFGIHGSPRMSAVQASHLRFFMFGTPFLNQCAESTHFLVAFWRARSIPFGPLPRAPTATDGIHCFGNRQDAGTRSQRVLHDLFEERRGASVRRGSLTDVVGGKYQPSPGLTILVDDFFDEGRIIFTLLQKVRPQETQIDCTRVECLASAPTATEVPADSSLRTKAWPAYRIGKRPESGSRNKFSEGPLVLDY